MYNTVHINIDLFIQNLLKNDITQTSPRLQSHTSKILFLLHNKVAYTILG